MLKPATEADVFIIETLDPDDEGNGRFEGSSLTHVLRLHAKRPEYRYIRTRDQLMDAVEDFRRSRYRYLHVSCHGDREGMVTTNQDEVSNADLATLLGTALSGRRLFLSACSMVHKEAARAIIPATQCTSIVGPRRDIAFAEAAVFWPALYHLMFMKDRARITHATLCTALQRVVALFEVEIGLYTRSPRTKEGYRLDLLKP